MINKVYFQSISQITNYISSINDQKSKIVTPSPETADFVRKSLQRNSKTNQLDVITFSNFLSSLKKNFSSLDEQVIYRKSQQLLILGAAYRKLNRSAGLNFTSFENCYTILTDLKSYSTNYEVLENILEHYTEETKEYVLKLFMLQNNLQLIDEHQALYELSECIRSEIPFEYEQAENFYFIGFEHISPVQIDFFRSLSLRSKLSFFIPQIVQKNSINSDWFNWLDGDEDYLPQLDCEHTDVKFYNVNQIDFVKKINQDSENKKIFIAGKNTEPVVFDLFGKKQKNYKRKIGLFDGQVNEVKIKLLRFISKGKTPLASLIDFYRNEIDSCLKSKNYLKMKVLIEYQRVANNWAEYFDKVDLVSNFELDLFEEIVHLDLPRLYNISAQSEGEFNEVELLGSFSQSDDFDIAIYFGPNSLSKGGSVNHLGKVYSILSSLGPIHRPELTNYFTLSGVSSLMASQEKSASIFIDEKLDKETDITESLKEIFNKEIDYIKSSVIEHNTLKVNLKEREGIPEKVQTRKHSANSLQTYMDCPQQYYIKYRIGSFQPLEIDDQLNPFESGRLLHFIVEQFFKNKFKNNFEEDVLEYIESEIHHFFSRNKKNFSANLGEDLLSELGFKAKKMILFIQKILIDMKMTDWSTEYALKSQTDRFNGSIDFLAYNDNTVVILDLKSSVGSKYSKKNVVEFNHIQLWVYLLSLKEFIGERNILFGYFGFRDLSSSTVFYVNKRSEVSTLDLIMGDKENDLSKLKVETLSGNEFEEMLNDFNTFQLELTKQIQEDQKFSPIPKSTSVCEFCDFNQLCKKDGESLLW